MTRSQPAGHLSTDGCADNRRLEIRQGLLTAQWRARPASSGEVGWGDQEPRVTQAERAGGLDPTVRPGSKLFLPPHSTGLVPSLLWTCPHLHQNKADYSKQTNKNVHFYQKCCCGWTEPWASWVPVSLCRRPTGQPTSVTACPRIFVCSSGQWAQGCLPSTLASNNKQLTL